MALALKQATKTISVAGTAEPIFPSHIPATSITIQADSLNTGDVYIGNSDVDSTNGFALCPGGSYPLTGDQIRGITEGMYLDEIYADTDTNDNKIVIIYFVRHKPA